MNLWKMVCGLSAGVALATAAQAQTFEVQFTGTVTAVGGVAGAAVGDGVAGTMSFDLGLLPAPFTDGATYAQRVAASTFPAPSPSHATLTLSSGTSFATGVASGLTLSSVDIDRNYGSNGFNVFALSSSDLFGPADAQTNSISLTVSDLLGLATAIFSTPAGDLSLPQPIDWFAAGATASGMFETGASGGGNFALTSVHVGPVSPAPEPDIAAMLVCGLAATTVAARRRRSQAGTTPA